ncbi:MAG: hypothetical protein L3J45_00795 [Flavobacteriaceae bacterium]|nr:hypothetical protein [Flavobacteriaceae bacterium]
MDKRTLNQMRKEAKDTIDSQDNLITRKAALKKTARFMALTALSTFVILNPKKAQAQSGGPGGPGFN